MSTTPTTPTDPLPLSDTNLHRERTTFPHDLRLLSTLLSSLPHPIPLPPQAGPQEHDIGADLPDMLNDIFGIIIYDYDIRNPTDYEEMKDTAGLSEEHFLDIRKRLYPGREPYADEDDECDELECVLDHLCSSLNIIEGMRDLGMKAPRFGLGDKVVLRDGRASPVSAAYSDEIEFFHESDDAERESKSEEQAGTGKEEEK